MTFAEMKNQMQEWIDELVSRRISPANSFRFEDLESDSKDGSVAGRYIFCTYAHQYSVRFVSHERTYLGCVASCRVTRPGETWTRGSDLADGEFSRETWDRILWDILAYELVELSLVTEIDQEPAAVPVG